MYERLEREGVLSQSWGIYVLAALEGADELDAVLERSAPAPAPPRAAPSEARRGVFISSITVQGFRGIGAERTLELTPTPGLTLVVGRNGSGKSSFAEALEVLLTGDSKRWAGRPALWREGWRNLHHPHPTVVEAAFSMEDVPGTIRVVRSWDRDAALEEGTAVVRRDGAHDRPLASLGWERDLSTFRPFLSYNELGSMLEEGPSKLYDALSVVLGLDDLVAAQNALADRRRARERAVKHAGTDLAGLLPELEAFAAGNDDERARRALAALGDRAWDLDELEAVLGAGGSDDEPSLRALRVLAGVSGPDTGAVLTAVEELRAAQEGLDAVAGGDAARAHELAGLLEQALRFHASHDPADCPVCGAPGALGEAWRAATIEQVDRLRDEARAVREANEAAAAAERAARALIVPLPAEMSAAPGLGIDVAGLEEAWQRWLRAPAGGPGALADHLEAHADAVASAAAELRAAAAKELRAREDAWRPIAMRLLGWLAPARAALAGAEAVPGLKQAETWLKQATSDIRNERFAPIAAQAIELWNLLRQRSNVTLGSVALSGTATQRRVELDVTVDGVEGAALGVMSQGELHCLALSLFLPRVMLDEPPFRFVVIDDPVQSMDPARVDGLARVLQEVAGTRQVVVFTHDDRLPEAVRRLQIPARVIEVSRRLYSTVELRSRSDPVDAAIDDALAIAHTDGLPEQVAARVVPGLCRAALEAACVDAYRRRHLLRGEARHEVEDVLERADKLSLKVALALFDDAARAGDVMKRLNLALGGWAGDTFKDCNRGTHEVHGGSLIELCERSRKLARWLCERA